MHQVSTRAERISADLFGGLTAAIVALPLALAFGVSSGAGPLAGLYGAICVGFFAALFGGTPSQISGPTGPMTVVMAAIFTEFSAADPVNGPYMAFTVVMLGGLFQLSFGLLRLGNYITMVPFPVISGFMSGIGVIIILLELAPLLGHPAGSGILNALQLLPEQVATTNPWALLLGLGTLILMQLIPKTRIKRFPPALIALVIGSLLVQQLPADAAVPLLGAIPTGLPQLHWPSWSSDQIQAMLSAALVLAALGSIDSLLTSLVADSMTRTQHDSNKELIGQGIGNAISGLLGGLPGAGATMRTVVNIRAGGRTSVSGMTHALVLLVLVLGLGWMAESIPHAVLAGILLKVGIDIIDWPFLKRLHQVPALIIGLTLLVFTLTVFVDLITAVLVGMFIANLITVKRLADIQLLNVKDLQRAAAENWLTHEESDLLTRNQHRVAAYFLQGPFSYAASKELRNRLILKAEQSCLLLDFSGVPLIDISTALALEMIVDDLVRSGKQVIICGANGVVANVFDRLRLGKLIGADNLLTDRAEAFARLREQSAAL